MIPHVAFQPRSLNSDGGLPQPPLGFVFLVDWDGAYLMDADGAYLMEPA